MHEANRRKDSCADFCCAPWTETHHPERGVKTEHLRTFVSALIIENFVCSTFMFASDIHVKRFEGRKRWKYEDYMVNTRFLAKPVLSTRMDIIPALHPTLPVMRG